jgi:pimeloyl-ACP methyl ester carboxylesterase
MKTTSIRGPQGQLSVTQSDQGEGLPVLFLHADSGRGAQWVDMARQIGDDRRAVTFDFRGSGESEPARDDDYGYEGRAADVDSVADTLGLGRFVVVAHSGGAAVALEYGFNHPQRVAGLLLVDPPTDPRALPKDVRDGLVRDLAGPRSLEVQQAYYRTIAGPNVAVCGRVLADCVAVTHSARAGFGAALASWNPEPTLNAWRGPIFILATPANDNEHALYRLREGIPHEVISPAGHWVQLDQPALVEQSIRRFVHQVESGER